MGGFSAVRLDPIGSVMNADNVSFDGTERGGVITTDGQLLIGSTVLPHIRVGTLTAGAGISISNGNGSITITNTGGGGGGGGLTTLTGNTGSANQVGGVIAVPGSNGITTNGSGSTLTISLGATVATTYTANSGSAVPALNNLNLLGTGSITTSGSGSTITSSLTGLVNHAVLVGAGTATITNVGPSSISGQILQSQGAAADPQFSTATYPATTTINQILYSNAANTVVGLATANNGVLTTGTTGIPVITALATNGQLIIGSSSGAPAAATLTAGTGVTITNAANSITIGLNGSVVGQTITGNDATALSPTAGNWNIFGTGSLITSGAGSTLTASLTGLTNHAVLVGAGTATITKISATATTGQILQNNASADPSYSTATYPSTTTINQLLYSSSSNVVAGLATVNSAVLATTSAGVPEWTALTDGQLVIGSTAGEPEAATLTAGTGVSITNASNSITIANTGLTTLSDDVGATVTPLSNNIQLVGHVVEQGATKFSTVVAGTNLLNINPMSSARWIVDPLGFNGTHTTIASALTSATSGDTIFLMPGTYTENPTLKAGVNITAWGSDSSLNYGTGNVLIIGKLTFTGAGTVSLYGLTLQTNSDFLLAVTGSSASIVNLNNCTLRVTNNTAISFTSSVSTSAINIWYSTVTQTADNIAYFSHSSAGLLYFYHSHMGWTGTFTNSASTASAGGFTIDQCVANFALTQSGSNTLNVFSSYLDSNNQTTFTMGGSGGSIRFSAVNSGTSTAIVANVATSVYMCSIGSNSVTAAISGTNTLTYSGLTFVGSSQVITTTTQSGGLLPGGRTQAPSAGFIGEQIRTTIASGAAVNVNNSTATNIMNISLTAGVWDVSGICMFVGAGVTGGADLRFSISTTSVTEGTFGDNLIGMTMNAVSGADQGLSIPSYRITLSSTTTVYIVAFMIYSTGQGKAYGRLSATRVG